jgi:hypothetical protein
MKTVTESIYSGKTAVIPLSEVQHIEHRGNYSMIVFKSCTWNTEIADYNNAICLHKDERAGFLAAWCRYRSELEADTLMDLSPERDPRSLAAPTSQSADVRLVEIINQLNGTLDAIGDLAHDKSTGPTELDTYWEIRTIAYEGQVEIPAALAAKGGAA